MTARCPICRGARVEIVIHREAPLYRCGKCRHRFVHPQPDDAALARYYGTAYYGGPAPVHAPTPPEVFVQILGWLPGIDGPLLDLGCGPATLYTALPKEAKQHYTGIEPDPGARRAAREKTGCPVAESLEALNRPTAFFQTILLNQTIEHLRDPLTTLARLRTLARPGAVLFAATANACGLKSRLRDRRWEPLQDRTHLHLFSAQSLEKALETGGWTGIRRITAPLRYPNGSKARHLLQGILRRLALDGNLTMTARCGE